MFTPHTQTRTNRAEIKSLRLPSSLNIRYMHLHRPFFRYVLCWVIGCTIYCVYTSCWFDCAVTAPSVSRLALSADINNLCVSELLHNHCAAHHRVSTTGATHVLACYVCVCAKCPQYTATYTHQRFQMLYYTYTYWLRRGGWWKLSHIVITWNCLSGDRLQIIPSYTHTQHTYTMHV